MEQHKLTIDMNEATIEQLRDHHFALFGLHAVATSASGAPTIWLSVHYIERHLEVSWQETYSMFTTRNITMAPSTKVVATHNYPAPLGSVLTVAGNDGAGIVTPGGPAGHMEIDNTGRMELGAGLCIHDTHGMYQPIGIFDLIDVDLFQPVQKMAFFFSPIPHMAGEVVTRSLGPGVLLDYSMARNHALSIEYDLHHGWSVENRPYAKAIAANEPLNPTLIVRSTALQALAMQRQRTTSR
ncbi:hypothetical protein KZZ52_58960 [Dactylosporangium sp. AC04546]|uniref:hypothetical protein n=1 Tax=Dactylosporangium sp. AC04546 TaxID=2862460 RepID=UPI001EDDE9DF|nr:hypothetical protein [Dactylosporangium sp. AC04546]WVK83672.1 hypothetical protein KZZ52_58960 [Dactylosporangium sp. AC04546]